MAGSFLGLGLIGSVTSAAAGVIAPFLSFALVIGFSSTTKRCR